VDAQVISHDAFECFEPQSVRMTELDVHSLCFASCASLHLSTERTGALDRPSSMGDMDQDFLLMRHASWKRRGTMLGHLTSLSPVSY